jgi:DNA-binding NarL/FixJ family response regulator
VTSEIRILIADDHSVVRKGLRQAIESDPAIKVIAECGDGETALARIAELRPEIALLDLDMPKLDGFGVIRGIQKSKLPVEAVLLTIHDEEDLFLAAMDLGVKGYILKESALLEIVTGLRSVAAGKHYVSASLTSYLVQCRGRAEALAQTQPALRSLTSTERHIVQAIAKGRSSKEIAAELFIHYRTVENHRTNICQKLGLSGSNSLLKFALEHRREF